MIEILVCVLVALVVFWIRDCVIKAQALSDRMEDAKYPEWEDLP